MRFVVIPEDVSLAVELGLPFGLAAVTLSVVGGHFCRVGVRCWDCGRGRW